MKILRLLPVCLLLLSLTAASGYAYTLSGAIDGGEWFGGITYVYAFAVDSLQFNFYLGLALLGNGPYLVLAVPAGDYILLAYQDRDGNLIPSIDDYMGYYGGQTPTTITVSGNMSGLDITIGALPFTVIAGTVSCDSGYTGLTTIQTATDPLFADIVNTGILISLDGNGAYTVFVTEPGEYYVRAYLDADFSLSVTPEDPQTFYGVPGTPQLVDVTGGSAQGINLDLIPPPDAALTMTPQGTPIVIPPQGGSFNYTITVANNGATAVSTRIWLDVTLPSGSVYGPLVGPVTLNLPAGFSASRNRTQSVPGAAPAGTYSYNAYLGYYPAIIWQEESFTFSKSGVEDGGMANWNSGGEALDDGNTPVAATSATQPEEFSMVKVYPNPFNPSTVASFELRVPSFVSLQVFDTAGRLVETLVNGWREAGSHEVTFDGSMLASGVYLYRLEAGRQMANGKMVLLK